MRITALVVSLVFCTLVMLSAPVYSSACLISGALAFIFVYPLVTLLLSRIGDLSNSRRF